MFDDFTVAARELMRDAGDRARSMGHNWVGCEHLLLALAANDGPVGEVMRGHGVTVPRVEKILLSASAGPGRTAGLLDTLDREALASIGIDLDTVRETVERAFGPTAFRPIPARPPRRFPPRFPPRFARRHHGSRMLTRRARDCVKGATKTAKAGHGLVNVDHLAIRVVTLNQGGVARILGSIGVSRPQLMADLMRCFHTPG